MICIVGLNFTLRRINFNNFTVVLILYSELKCMAIIWLDQRPS